MNKVENNLNRELNITFKWNNFNVLSGLTIGATYSTDEVKDFKKFEYKVPYFTLSSITDAIKHNVSTDIVRYKLDRYITIGKCYYDSVKKYVLTDLKEVWDNYKKEKLVIATFTVLASVPLVGSILAFTQNESKSTQEVKINRIFTDTIKEDGTFVSSDTILNTQAIMKQKIAAKLPLTINKKPIKTLVECSFPTMSKAKIEKKLVKSIEKKTWKAKGVERKKVIDNVNKVDYVNTLTPDEVSDIILSGSEGYWAICYYDYNQMSVGYGSFISPEDCKKLWKRMGLSEQEGKDIAYKIHNLQIAGKWKEAAKINDSYKHHKGCFSLTEADELRDKEFEIFKKHVDENYTFLPEYQRMILSNLCYNTGRAGLDNSPLGKALRENEWNSKAVYDAFTKTKVHVKVINHKTGKKECKYLVGLYNRRVLDRNAFFATENNHSLVATNKLIAENLQTNP